MGRRTRRKVKSRNAVARGEVPPIPVLNEPVPLSPPAVFQSRTLIRRPDNTIVMAVTFAYAGKVIYYYLPANRTGVLEPIAVPVPHERGKALRSPGM